MRVREKHPESCVHTVPGLQLVSVCVRVCVCVCVCVCWWAGSLEELLQSLE